ncbi:MULTISPECIES: ParB/RepB/Spo0J family partition protein [unclassified Cupriavidus]|uniref:ParB/RepB/Spo0J family partition protein n=1 Tax=unclassified Cupriavidus TaxID=2640874 RepID=UPI001F02A0CD|nr:MULTISPECIES: ParB/RepB/Spo0J family partition protein [unclassified Cupriavidus]
MTERKRSFQPPPVAEVASPGGDTPAAAPVPGGGFKIAAFPKRSAGAATVPVTDAVTTAPAPAIVAAEHAPVTVSEPSIRLDDGAVRGFPVAIDRLETHPWNARIHRSAARIKELSLQMSTDGQESPIIVTKNPAKAGYWFIVDGETRFRSGQKLGWNQLWALERAVDPNDAKEFYAVSFERTDSTEPISQIDQGLRWAELVGKGHATLEWLAERLDRSKATISNMLSYGKFPQKVTDRMAEHSEAFPYTVAAELSRQIGDMSQLGDDQLLALVDKVIDENVSRRGIEALVRQFVREPGAKRERKAALTNRPIMVGSAKGGSLREYANGGIELKLQPSAALSTEAKQELLEILGAAVDALNSGGGEGIKEVLLERLSAGKRDV